MNKAFLIIFTSFICGKLAFAQVYSNNLVFYSEKGKVFSLYVNNEKINALPQSDVKAFNVNEGWQKIRIEFNDEKDKSVLQDSIRIKQFEKNENSEFTYMISDAIKNQKPYHKLVFVSHGSFSGPATPRVPEEPKEIIPLVDSAVYGNLYRARNGKPIFFSNYDAEAQTCKVDLTDKDIKIAIKLVDKTNDFEDKFKYIGQTIQNNCYTAAQLVLLLNLLEIEMDKLKLAQKAYPHLKDKSNAANVNQAFKYPTIKEEYDAFLKDVSVKQQQKKLECNLPLNEVDFDKVYQSVKNISNEYDKTKFAKKQLQSNCFSTEQIGKLMNLFTHDRERLEFVKSAYLVVTDKANFEKVAEEFQFSENKAEFLKFISQ